jgi:Cu/Ag efflux pump CusA
MMSLFGLIALSGVVVNDSLIMVDFINKARQDGQPLKDAVIESGTLRFRAIVLTSLTTAMGLLPIMAEKSLQAQYLQPMAISMCFGIVFATVITLFLVPALYMLLIDGGYVWTKANLLLRGREEEYKSLTRQGYLQMVAPAGSAELTSGGHGSTIN